MRQSKRTACKARLNKSRKRKKPAPSKSLGGRPPGYSPLPPDQEPRTEIIQVRFRPSERREIEAAAKQAGLTVSAWIRKLLLFNGK